MHIYLVKSIKMMPLRLRRVSGFEGRQNDTLFLPAAVRPASLAPRDQQTLVFFGGDVQDYLEVMEVHRDNRNYQHWNLERTARILGQSFPNKHILVVRPSRYGHVMAWGNRIEFKSFSCYDNFVPSNNAGVPEHTPTHKALHHLERLLQNVSSRLKQMPQTELLEALTCSSLPEEIDIEDLHKSSVPKEAACESEAKPGQTQASAAGPEDTTEAPKPDCDPLWWRERLSLEQSKLTLAGFSKGCVVLNQLIYEFHYTKTLTPGDLHTMRFIERMESMYWLDGGHAGGKNTWLTARSLLETLTRTGIDIYIHVSPYQVQDEARPWIGREEKAFTGMLKKLGAKVHRYLHDGGAPYSLHTHFDVIANFKRAQDAAPAPSPAAPEPAPEPEDDT